MDKSVSVIIPTYNEEQTIVACLVSLKRQSYKNLEIIVVDDGSTDDTLKIMARVKSQTLNYKLLNQSHLGPGPARNLGVQSAKGEILVFVDADMVFDKNFIRDLTKPILDGKTIGTFSKNEFNLNKDIIWSACWNINRNWPINRLITPDYPETAPVFRAILKREFEKVGGFDTTGEYTDDWSLSKKLQRESTLAKGAIYHHSNPSTLPEVFRQARWIGKNQFISGNILRKVRSLIFYSLPLSLILGFYKALRFKKIQFILFKIIYDFGIFASVLKSFTREPKYK